MFQFLILLQVLPIFSQTPYPGWENPKPVNKILKYSDSYLTTSGGTCGYGPIYGLEGIVMAANTALYSDDPNEIWHFPNATGDGCGICYNVVGPGGSAIVINADICDDETNCVQSTTAGPSFNLYDNTNSQRQVWKEVVGNYAGGVLFGNVTYQKVSCPLKYFNNNPVGLNWKMWTCCASSGQLPTAGAMEWTVINHRVKVTGLNVKNSAGGQFMALNRSWTNDFSAPYYPEDGNLLWWVFNQQYSVQITSETNTIEFTIDPSKMIDAYTGEEASTLPANDQLGPSENPRAGTYLSNLQFNDFEGSSSNSIPILFILLISLMISL